MNKFFEPMEQYETLSNETLNLRMELYKMLDKDTNKLSDTIMKVQQYYIQQELSDRAKRKEVL